MEFTCHLFCLWTHMAGSILTGGQMLSFDEIKHPGVQGEHITSLVTHNGWLGNVTKYIRYSEMLGNTCYGCGKGNLEL